MLRASTPNEWSSNATKNLNSFLTDLLPASMEQKLSIKDLTSYRANLANTNSTDFPARQTITVQQIYPKDSNQAMKNLKSFYKKCLDTDLKSRRLRFLSSRQKKRGSEASETSQNIKSKSINKLAETNLNLFKNMNELFAKDCSFRRIKNDQPPLYKAENEIVQSYNRNLSSKNKRAQYSIMTSRKDSVYIPIGYSMLEETDKFNSTISKSNIVNGERKYSGDKSLSHQTFIPQVSENSNVFTKLKSLKQHDYIKEKRNKNNSFFLNNTYFSKNDQSNISGEVKLDKTEENKSKTVFINDHKNLNKNIRAVSARITKRMSSTINEESSMSKNSNNLMTKIIKHGAYGGQTDNNQAKTLALYNLTDARNSNTKSERRSASAAIRQIKTFDFVLNS